MQPKLAPEETLVQAAPSKLRSANLDWARALQRTAAIQLTSTRTLAEIVDDRATTAPDHPALVGETMTLSYAALAGLSRRVARWGLSLRLGLGDRVALLMANEPAYVAIWLGLSRIGVVTALLNTNLAGAGLAHCIAAASPRHLIVGGSCLGALDGVGVAGLEVWRWENSSEGSPESVGDLAERLATLPADPLSIEEAPPVPLRHPALLIYTSGTTGLPKAAYVSHFRIVMWSEWFAGIMDARPADRLYDCLPMYHAVGGVVAIGSMLAAGGTVLIRRGFSVSRFWDDLAASGATIFQYIGELCRYLVAAPEHPAHGRHTLRLCCGNGLRAEVWTAFAERFAIPQIIEFYAATEGSFSLFNLEGRPGAIGRIPPFMAHRSPVAIVRHDPVSEAPVRSDNGFCQPCGVDEAGEAIGRLSTGDAALASRFEGYTNAADSERKILRDVFAAGDLWFRTGDLMLRDRQGFFFFVDRIGDTFRWKGENVSTLDVADALSAAPGIVDATVYGVPVPGAEGRAGMAALVVGEGFELALLQRHSETVLPRYARPVFLRIVSALAKTETFRAKKAELRHEGFDPSIVTDPVYVFNGSEYQRLGETEFRQIADGQLRL